MSSSIRTFAKNARALFVTTIYPGISEADETEWQRLVLAHLGITG